MNIGENLRKIRLERNVTQAELAEKIGVTQSMLCQIERGTKALSVMLAVDIAKYLKCDLDELLGIEKTPVVNGQA